MSCKVTDHTATQTTFGPTLLANLGLSKKSNLKSMGSSWATGMATLSYGGTFIEVYVVHASTQQNHAQLINDYIYSGNNPSWFGDLEVWPDDELQVLITDNQMTTDSEVRIRGEYVFA